MADCTDSEAVTLEGLTELSRTGSLHPMALKNGPDLTQHPPRSPRLRLGGYVILPRMLDKGRATLAGKHGEYNYACPLDQRFLQFSGIDADALKQQLAAGKGDWEILGWLQTNSTTKPKQTDI